MLHLLVATTDLVNPKQKAIDAASPNAIFEPSGTLVFLAAAFFIASAVMVWLIIRAGKDHDYNS